VTPSLSGYDTVILGAAVEGFSLSPVLKAYLEQLPGPEASAPRASSRSTSPSRGWVATGPSARRERCVRPRGWTSGRRASSTGPIRRGMRRSRASRRNSQNSRAPKYSVPFAYG
jgi:hypothetical protein